MKNPREKIVEVARRYLGISEASKNRFAGIEKLWAATNYPDGWKNREPYCSAFASMCVQVADQESPALRLQRPPRFAAVSQWKAWARSPDVGVQIVKPFAVDPLPGDVVSFLPRLSHIGIVEWFDKVNGLVHTIEANTNAAGSREGDGIYRKQRQLGFCGEFYRLPARGERV